MLTVEDKKGFNWREISLIPCLEGNMMDTYFTLAIYEILIKNLQEKNLEHFYEKVIEPAFSVFAEMEYRGIDVDTDQMTGVARTLHSKVTDGEDKLHELDFVDSEENIHSNKVQRGHLYTNEGGCELYPPDWTKKKKPSVSKDTLKLLLEQIGGELEERIAE